MDGWIDGWSNGWMDGWMDGWMHGWKGGWMGAGRKGQRATAVCWSAACATTVHESTPTDCCPSPKPILTPLLLQAECSSVILTTFKAARTMNGTAGCPPMPSCNPTPMPSANTQTAYLSHLQTSQEHPHFLSGRSASSTPKYSSSCSTHGTYTAPTSGGLYIL
jgi:hypothetical protein